MTKLKKQKKYQKLAREGNYEIAIKGLTKLHNEGDYYASVSLAELEAFQRNWDIVVDAAFQSIIHTYDIGSNNLPDEMISLVAYAADQKKNWEEIEEKIKVAKIEIRKLPKDKKDGLAYLNELNKYIKSKTSKISKLFKKHDFWDYRMIIFPEDSNRSIEEKDRLYNEAFKDIPTKSKTEILIKKYQYADIYHYDEKIIEIYKKEGFSLGKNMYEFDEVKKVASYLAKNGLKDDAWKIIKENIHMYWPLYYMI